MNEKPNAISEIRKLRHVITNIDALSQEGFSDIAALAKLALIALDTPDYDRNIAAIARALSTIFGKAQDIENSINHAASEVGCDFRDPPTARNVA